VKRFLSIFFPPAEFTKLAITVDIAGQKFYANSKICTKQGYLEVVKEDSKDDEKKEDIEAARELLKNR
jgi:DNA topoisomerase-3